MINFISKLLKRDTTSLVVRKTDDELTRHMKQYKRTQNRINFEKNIEDEEKRKELKLNTHEIRV